MPSNINQFSEQEIRHQETEITYDKEFIYTILIDRSINFILLMLIILQMFLFNKTIPQIFTIFILFLAILLCYIIQSKRISFLFKFLDSYQRMLYILFCLIDFTKLYNYFLILEHLNFLFLLRFFSDLFVTLCLIFWVLKNDNKNRDEISFTLFSINSFIAVVFSVIIRSFYNSNFYILNFLVVLMLCYSFLIHFILKSGYFSNRYWFYETTNGFKKNLFVCTIGNNLMLVYILMWRLDLMHFVYSNQLSETDTLALPWFIQPFYGGVKSLVNN